MNFLINAPMWIFLGARFLVTLNSEVDECLAGSENAKMKAAAAPRKSALGEFQTPLKSQKRPLLEGRANWDLQTGKVALYNRASNWFILVMMLQSLTFFFKVISSASPLLYRGSQSKCSFDQHRNFQRFSSLFQNSETWNRSESPETSESVGELQ